MGSFSAYIKSVVLGERFGPWYLRTWACWLLLGASGLILILGGALLMPLSGALGELALRLVGLLAMLIPIGPFALIDSFPSKLAVPIIAMILIAYGDTIYVALFGRRWESRLLRLAFNVLYLFALSVATDYLIYGSWESLDFLLSGDTGIE